MGTGNIWKISVPSIQHYCEPKGAVRNNIYFFKHIFVNLDSHPQIGVEIPMAQGPDHTAQKLVLEEPSMKGDTGGWGGWELGKLCEGSRRKKLSWM